MWSKLRFVHGTYLPACSLSLSLASHHSGPGRKLWQAWKDHWTGFVCKGAGRVKGSHKGWWDTRGLTAVGSCSVTTWSSDGQKMSAVTGTGWSPEDRSSSCNLEGGSCCPTCQRESWLSPTALWPVSASHWTNPVGSQKGKKASAFQDAEQVGEWITHGTYPGTGLRIPHLLSIPPASSPPRLSSLDPQPPPTPLLHDLIAKPLVCQT